MNNWAFTGNLGGDAETRYLQSGKPVTTFSVAVKYGYGDRENTIWPKCQLWGDRGEKLAEHLKKGTQVAVVGEMNVREWDDKDGNKQRQIEVNVTSIDLIGKKPEGKKPAAKPAADLGDDIPF